MEVVLTIQSPKWLARPRPEYLTEIKYSRLWRFCNPFAKPVQLGYSEAFERFGPMVSAIRETPFLTLSLCPFF